MARFLFRHADRTCAFRELLIVNRLFYSARTVPSSYIISLQILDDGDKRAQIPDRVRNDGINESRFRIESGMTG